jgi:hypothetical protein
MVFVSRVPQNRHLRTLELCRCKVGDEGALAILDALEKNSSLTKCKPAASILPASCLNLKPNHLRSRRARPAPSAPPRPC